MAKSRGITGTCLMLRVLLVVLLALAGCIAPLPPGPQELEAKRFETVPGKAVVYVVRGYPDLSPDTGTLTLDDNMMGSTHPGTFFRWVMEPGRHQIRGYAGDNGGIVIDVLPDRVY